MQLPDALEVGVVLGQQDMGHIELGNGQAVLLEAGKQLFVEGGGDLPHLLIHLQQVDLLALDDGGQVGLYRVGDQGPEGVLEGLGEPGLVAPGDAGGGAHQLDQQLPAVLDLQIQLTGGPDLQRGAGEGVDEPHLVRRAPLDGHLDGLVDEVDLGVEGLVGAGGHIIQLFQDGELLGLQGVPARSEQVQGLTVPEEDGLLALVDDELGPHVEILHGVLPDQGLVVALVLNDAGQTGMLDLLRFQPLGHIVHRIADRAGVCTGALAGLEEDAALGAVELGHFGLLRLGVDGLPADGALGLLPFGLVKDHLVAAVGALPGGQLVHAHIDDVAAGAVDLLPGEEAGFCLGVFAAAGTFNDKFGHIDTFIQMTYSCVAHHNRIGSAPSMSGVFFPARQFVPFCNRDSSKRNRFSPYYRFSC